MNDKDMEILRRLAKRVKELSCSKENLEKSTAWQKHNDLVSNSRSLVLCDPENGWNEIFTPSTYECEDGMAKHWEFLLKREIYSATILKDDKVLTDEFYIGYYHSNSGWGLNSRHSTSGVNGAYKTIAALDNYNKLELLKYPKIEVDYENTNKTFEQASELFEGILNVKRGMSWWWSLGLSNTAIDLRGIEDFMMDMYDYPDKLHRFMNILCEGNLQMLDYLQDNDLLCQNNANQYVGSGGYGFTSQIAIKNKNITTMDMWGFTESQETSGVSPEMFEEFVFPYQLKIAKRFALNCYGCCEGLDNRFNIIKQIPNLRRVSVSHWAKANVMAEQLGKNYVFSLKPSPSYLATSKMDEDAARRELKEKIGYAKANNCHIEIIMKDNHTLGRNPNNATRWVEIAREELGE